MSGKSKKVIVVVLVLGALTLLGWIAYGVFSERTVMPANEYSDSSENNDQQQDSENAAVPSVNNTLPTSDKVAGKKTVAPGSTSIESNSSSEVAGRQLTASDFHINHKLNARLRFSNFFNTFKEGDYVTGKDLAILYGNDKEINSVVRKIIVKYLQEHIDFIQRSKGQLIINTVDQKPAVTKVYVPLLIDLNLTIKHGSTIGFGKTFVAKEKNFFNICMLPVNLNGIALRQSDDSIPEKGYVSGDNYYVNYSGSLDCYKLK